MTKRLNEEAMQRELSGSAFFALKPAEAPAPFLRDPKAPSAAEPLPAPLPGPDVSTPAPPPVRLTARTPGRRAITRYAFEFYQDQVARLREISLQQKSEGENGSMSEMVRKALDDYLSQREEGTDRESVRSG